MTQSIAWHIYPVCDFSKYIAQWDFLNEQTTNCMLLSSNFITPLLKHFSSGNEKLVILGNSASPEAMAIINKTGFGRWTTFQPSQAPIGCWLQKPALDTSHLCKTLAKKIPGPTLIFSITQQDPDLLQRPEDSSNQSTLDYIETARITISSDFDSYWSKRSKNLRQGLRRQRNRLEREKTETLLIKITAPSDIREAVAAYGKLESASWKSETGTAINIENTQGAFYQELLETFCAKGHGLVYQYWYNGELAATDLCITDTRSIVILKTTYDGSINTSSPAMLMRQDAFKEIFDNRLFSRIEFYGKVMDWHKKWSDEIRVMFHTNNYSLLAKALSKLK